MKKDGLIIPDGYVSQGNLIETEINIKKIKDFFEKALSKELNLTRVSAPLFVDAASGLNDNLNGVERAVSFDIKATETTAEIVHSLAKWKRLSLKRYGFSVGAGLYTDMNAIRRDEDLDNLHSIYVDQWDWEKIINKEERNENTLKTTVGKIYKVLKDTEKYVCNEITHNHIYLPDNIYFITTQELEDRYPNLSPKEREDEICKEQKAVFIMKIGDKLKSGKKHDGRAPDYDDWNLNGDIIVWNELLNRSFELSSMGIRVDEESLKKQLEKTNELSRLNLPFHKELIEGKLPYTIGGGIGQSRICMFFLRKAHIGEVQASIWDDRNLLICKENNINLL
ncbi:MAG: aspartate--ammonia ligase [Clostridiales bacterium]|nr:aspartate--ammonia ligase [Clostridiales bacterium]